MTEQTAKQRRPFHESIVDAIRRASYSDMRCLGKLIQETKIPKGHDAIIAAWNDRNEELSREMREAGDVYGDLFEQKQEAEEKERAKKQQNEVATT
ncbi:MAG: hypothetical protein AAB584_00660 [Patescibacteria group bacterium]